MRLEDIEPATLKHLTAKPRLHRPTRPSSAVPRPPRPRPATSACHVAGTGFGAAVQPAPPTSTCTVHRPVRQANLATASQEEGEIRGRALTSKAPMLPLTALVTAERRKERLTALADACGEEARGAVTDAIQRILCNRQEQSETRVVMDKPRRGGRPSTSRGKGGPEPGVLPDLLRRLRMRLQAAAYTRGRKKNWVQVFRGYSLAGMLCWTGFYSMCRRLLKMDDSELDLYTLFESLGSDQEGRIALLDFMRAVGLSVENDGHLTALHADAGAVDLVNAIEDCNATATGAGEVSDMRYEQGTPFDLQDAPQRQRKLMMQTKPIISLRDALMYRQHPVRLATTPDRIRRHKREVVDFSGSWSCCRGEEITITQEGTIVTARKDEEDFASGLVAGRHVFWSCALDGIMSTLCDGDVRMYFSDGIVWKRHAGTPSPSTSPHHPVSPTRLPKSHSSKNQQDPQPQVTEPDPAIAQAAGLAVGLQEVRQNLQKNKSKEMDMQSWDVMALACDLNLTADEVAKGKQIYDVLDHRGNGMLDFEDFSLGVAKLIEHNTIGYLPEAKIKEQCLEHWNNSDFDKNGGIDFREFLMWFSQNRVREDWLVSANDLKLRELSKKYHMDVSAIEHIEHCYNEYDTDKSGTIEFAEFEQIVYKALKVPPGVDLPRDRINYFWREIDRDNSGKVDFDEFLPWWATRKEELSHYEGFYASIRFPKAFDPPAKPLPSLLERQGLEEKRRVEERAAAQLLLHWRNGSRRDSEQVEALQAAACAFSSILEAG